MAPEHHSGGARRSQLKFNLINSQKSDLRPRNVGIAPDGLCRRVFSRRMENCAWG